MSNSTRYGTSRHIRHPRRALVFFAALSGMLTTPGLADDLTFANPPAVGDTLSPQRDLYVCESVLTARYMANTGFVGHDCRDVIAGDDWHVIKCTRESLQHGDWWLIEVTNVAGDTAFIPLPWHDWA